MAEEKLSQVTAFIPSTGIPLAKGNSSELKAEAWGAVITPPSHFLRVVVFDRNSPYAAAKLWYLIKKKKSL